MKNNPCQAKNPVEDAIRVPLLSHQSILGHP